MANDCLQLEIDEVYINGILENIEEGSASIENASGWENEGVASASGDHGTRRKRVVPVLKYKRLTDASFNPTAYGSLDLAEIAVRDKRTQRRGRISRATFGSYGELGGKDNPEIKWILNSPVQWL